MRKTMRLLICALVLLSPAAHAAMNMRALTSIGLWRGSFDQSDTRGHSTEVNTLPSFGLEIGLGVSTDIFFVEYAFTWFPARYMFQMSSDPNHTVTDRRESVYYSLLGLNVGAKLPLLPLEAYVGIDDATYGFSTGTKTDYTGPAGKIGVNARFGKAFGLRLEYRKHYIRSDDAGRLPADISTSASTWFLGLVAGQF